MGGRPGRAALSGVVVDVVGVLGLGVAALDAADPHETLAGHRTGYVLAERLCLYGSAAAHLSPTEKEAAEAAFRELCELPQFSIDVLQYHFALAHLAIGRVRAGVPVAPDDAKDRALACLATSLSQRCPRLSYVHVDHRLDDLRGHDDFKTDICAQVFPGQVVAPGA